MNIPVRSLLLFFVFCLVTIQGIARSASTVLASSLVFVENKGQIRDQHHHLRSDIDFKLNAPGIDIFIGSGHLHYQWTKRNENGPTEVYRLDVALADANPHAEIAVGNKQAYFENYYLPECPTGTKAYSCKQIIYKNIYPNIDWVVYLNGNELKYDFRVHKGGNVKDIRIKYDGATQLQLQDGALHVSTPFGSITEHAPVSYNASSKENVPSLYKLSGNTLSFSLASQPDELVIDPQLAWATYYGGFADDMNAQGAALLGGFILYNRQGLATDGSGSLYFGGTTESGANIAMTGAFKATTTTQDAFIVKFSPTGVRLWATYYGGDSVEVFTSLACDKNNNVIATGYTYSATGIATPLSHQTALSGLNDGFVVKFDQNGNRLWGTYYGGLEADQPWKVATGPANEIYIAGGTRSSQNISTPGGHQTQLQNSSSSGSAFLVRFDASGVRQWGTYYCDSGSGYVSGLTVDKSGNVVFSGGASGSFKVATPGTHQLNQAGSWDIFITKFTDAGNRIWGTYLGGAFDDHTTNLATDDNDDIYLAGVTTSVDSISTPGAFLFTKPTGTNTSTGCLFKFSSAGKRLWGTYYHDYPVDLVIDKYNDVCIGGRSGNPTSQTATPGAWQTIVKGGQDGVFLKFDKDGNKLWATYYGGSNLDEFYSITKDISGNLYLSGITRSFDLVGTVGGHQTAPGGARDAFLIKTTPDSVVYINPVDTVICVNSNGADVQVGYTLTRSFRPGNIITVQLSDSNGSFASPFNIGNLTTTASGVVPCHIPVTVPLGSKYRIRVVASTPYYISTDNGKNIRIIQGPEKPSAFGDTLVCEDATLHLYATCPTAGVTYSWSGPVGFASAQQNPVRPNVKPNAAGNYVVTVSPVACKISDTVSVGVIENPVQPVIHSNAPICEGDTLRLRNIADSTILPYTWHTPFNTTDTSMKFVLPLVSRDHQGMYVLDVNRLGCVVKDSMHIIVKRKPVINATTNSPARIGKDLYLNADVDSGDAEYYKWQGPYGYTSTAGHSVRYNVKRDAEGTYNVTASVDGCTSTKQILVTLEDGVEQENYFEINPNPNKGTFLLSGVVKEDQSMPLDVVDALGQAIYTGIALSFERQLRVTIQLSDVAQGEYFLRIRVSNKTKVYRFIVSK